MRIRPAVAAVTAVGAAASLVPAAAIARDGDRDRNDGPQFEGRVVRVDRDDRRFRINDHESGPHRVYVNSRTRYERVNGLRGLRRGMRIEVSIRRSNGRWIATEVERDRPGDRRGRGRHDGNDDD
jgi:Domain of unknown function (DUF5666)